MVNSKTDNPQGLELSAVFDSLFSNKHFMNKLGDLLTKSLATTKIEKFLASQVRSLLKDITLNMEIEKSFQLISQRMQERLERLQNTEINFDLNQDD